MFTDFTDCIVELKEKGLLQETNNEPIADVRSKPAKYNVNDVVLLNAKPKGMHGFANKEVIIISKVGNSYVVKNKEGTICTQIYDHDIVKKINSLKTKKINKKNINSVLAKGGSIKQKINNLASNFGLHLKLDDNYYTIPSIDGNILTLKKSHRKEDLNLAIELLLKK